MNRLSLILMPTYEFRCPDGHAFEKFYRTISGAESQAACPTCGLAAGRMMSATGFAFKGSGFYLTDYGKNAHRGEAPPVQGGGDAPAVANSADTPKADTGAGESKAPTDKKEAAKSSDASGASKEPKKPESKAAEAKPAPAPPKPSAGE